MGSQIIQDAVSAPDHRYVIDVDPDMLDRARAERERLISEQYTDALARVEVYYKDQQAIANKNRIWLTDLRDLFDCDTRHLIRVAHQLEIDLWKAYKAGENGGSLAWATTMAGALTLAEYYARNTGMVPEDLLK